QSDIGFVLAFLGQQGRQQAAQGVADIGQEQGAHAAVEIVHIVTANSEHAQGVVVAQRNDGGRADLGVVLGEQDGQLFFLEMAADGFAAVQQAAQFGLGILEGNDVGATGRITAGFAKQGQTAELHLEIVAEAVFQHDHYIFQALGLQQADQQAFALLEKAVVLAGGFDQFAELALELVPLSPEQGDLVGDQGDGSAAAMRNPQLVHQLFMLNKKFWVSQQIA